MNAIAINAFSGEINNQSTTLVNAEDLHAYLGIQSRFSDWILRRIKEFGFVENQDFANVRKFERVRNAFGWREVEKTQYHLTLDMAKELCMVERSEIGRQARRYFIEIEKEHREAMPAWAVAQLSNAQAQLHAARELILQQSPLLRDIARYRDMGLSKREIGTLVGLSRDTVRVRYRDLEAIGIVPAVTLSRGRRPLGLPRGDAPSPLTPLPKGRGEPQASLPLSNA